MSTKDKHCAPRQRQLIENLRLLPRMDKPTTKTYDQHQLGLILQLARKTWSGQEQKQEIDLAAALSIDVPRSKKP